MFKTARISYITNYVLALFLLLLLVVFKYYLNADVSLWMTILIIFVSLLFIEEPEIERILRQYYITNHEVMKIEGFISKRRTIIPYQSVADVKALKSVVGRALNFGTVEVAGFKDTIQMKGMKNPDEIYEMINEKIASRKAVHPRVRTNQKE